MDAAKLEAARRALRARPVPSVAVTDAAAGDNDRFPPHDASDGGCDREPKPKEGGLIFAASRSPMAERPPWQVKQPEPAPRRPPEQPAPPFVGKVVGIRTHTDR